MTAAAAAAAVAVADVLHLATTMLSGRRGFLDVVIARH